MSQRAGLKHALVRDDFQGFSRDLIATLGLDGGEVVEKRLLDFLCSYFGEEDARDLRETISQDLVFFREHDPASTDYSEEQILSVRRGMAAIAAHRLFQKVLECCPGLLYKTEVVAKYVQKDTNVEIHPSATIGVPFAIDHGHGTVIGATSIVGKRVFIYHGVTLGATGKRSRADRRHPIIGDDVFFGNGSQVLGPSIIEQNVHIGSNAVIADCCVHEGVRISLSVRIARVVVPGRARILGASPERPQQYWVQLEAEDQPRWVELERFRPETHE
jgi:serine O-acetyltransferase